VNKPKKYRKKMKTFILRKLRVTHKKVTAKSQDDWMLDD